MASPATARASSVLPVPGGPTSSTPFGIRPPMLVYFFGVLRNSTISAQLLFRFVHAGDVAELHLDVVVGVDLRAAARERHDAALGAAHAAEEEAPQRDEEEERDDPAEHLGDPAAGDLAGVLDAVLPRAPRRSFGILDADGGERLAALPSSVFSVPRMRSSATVTSWTWPSRTQRLELAVGDRLARLQREEERLRERQRAAGTPSTYHIADAGPGAAASARRRRGGSRGFGRSPCGSDRPSI